MQDELVAILKRTGALITDSHFVGTSGRHMSVYINKDAFLPHTEEVSRVGELFAEKNKDLDMDMVVGPAIGGIILSQWTAFHLSRARGKEVLSIYTEKDADGNQIFKRGYDKLVSGKKVLLVEDTTTTGGSLKKVVDTVRAAGGIVLGACIMTNRDPKLANSESVGAPLSWLAEVPAESYEESECPLCAANVPVNTTVGHGKKFLESKNLA